MKKIILIEKWKSYDYIDQKGNRIWLGKYGEAIKIENKYGAVTILNTKTTLESIQKLNAFHNVNAEQELVEMLLKEIGKEIDEQIMCELIRNKYYTFQSNSRINNDGTITIDVVLIPPITLKEVKVNVEFREKRK